MAVAHFPPPVHGMAAAVDRLVTHLERDAPVRRVSISAPGLDRSPSYHLVRGLRVVRALGVLAVERRRASRAFFSCDAGPGMVYTLVLVAWARLLGYGAFLQHHSYAYLDHPSAVLAALVRAGGDACEHLVSCPQMEADLRAAHPGARTRVVGVAAGLPVAPTGADGRRASSSPLVLGFFGNVTVEKGIDLAVATVRSARAAGLPAELRVAGPVIDPHAEAVLSEAEADPGTPLVRLGPVFGADREAFLDGLDVFLFPSRYPHESFGLVAWEAMARGVPLLAHRSGCLTADAVGAGGLVVERDEDFAAATLATLRRWSTEPSTRAEAGRAARECALAAAEGSERDTARLCGELAAEGAGASRERY